MGMHGSYPKFRANLFSRTSNTRKKSISVQKAVRATVEPLERRTYLSITPSSNTRGITSTEDQPYDIGNVVGGGTFCVNPGVSVTLPEIQETNSAGTGSLEITSGSLGLGRLTLGSGSAAFDPTHVSIVNSLMLGNGGTLDLMNDVLIIRCPNQTARDMQFSTVETWLRTGSDNGRWDGTGIVSSEAKSDSGATGIGAIENYSGPEIAGQTIQPYDIVIAYALYGDINLSGAVTGTDFAIEASYFGTDVSGGWDQGDFNYNGVVNGTDFGLISQNFGKSINIPPNFPVVPAIVPTSTSPPRYVASFTSSRTPPTPQPNDFTANINWGDNSSSSNITSGAIYTDNNGNFYVYGNHTYQEEGPYTAGVTITDTINGDTATIPSSPNNPGTLVSVADAPLSISGVAPKLLSAVSQKFQGTRVYNINLPITGTPGVEDRAGGPTQIVLTFAAPIAQGPAFNVALSSGSVTSTSISGAALTLNLSGATNAQTLVINVTDVADAGTNIAGNYTFDAGVLEGDVDGSGIVDSNDLTLVQGTISAGGFNFKRDVDESGVVDATDLAIVNSQVGSTLSPAGVNSFAAGPVLYLVQGQSLAAPVADFSDTDTSSTAGPYTATLTWSDNTTSAASIATDNHGGWLVIPQHHAFQTPGTSKILITVYDEGGASISLNPTVVVLPTLPTLTISGSNSVVAGNPYTLNLSTQFSAADSSDGIKSYSINWGDGSPANPDVQVVTGNPFAANSLAVTHTYSGQELMCQITATATDLNGIVASSNVISLGVQPNPVVIAGVAASPNPVTGTTTNLTATATDTGDSPLTYTWSTIAAPPNVTQPSFSVNGTGTASSTTATFYGAGAYTFLITVTDSLGYSAEATIQVSVGQTASSIQISPSYPQLIRLEFLQFQALTYDQFGAPMASQPAFTWSKEAGDPGAIASNGLYFAGAASGLFAVTAQTGSLSATAVVAVGGVTDSSVIQITPQDFSANQNQSGEFYPGQFVDSDATQTKFNASIAWGDGTTSFGTITIEGGAGTTIWGSVSGTHTYTQAGIFQPTLTVTDQAQNTATVAMTATVGTRGGSSTDLVATATPYGAIDLKWVDDQGPTYEIDRSTDGINFTKLNIVPGTSASTLLSVYEDSGLSPNTVYYYRVESAGISTDASVASATTATGSGYSTTPLQANIVVPVTGVDDPEQNYEKGDVIQTVALQAGVHYELVASGIMALSDYGGPSGPTDAEYDLEAYPSLLMVHPDQTIDYGIGVDDVPSNSNRYPYWGPYTGTSVYAIDILGTGQPLTLNFHDNYYGDNSQQYSNLTLSIFPQLTTAVPPTPSSVIAAAQAANTINLSWSTVGESQATNYVIYRSTSSTFPGTIYANFPAGTGTTQSFLDHLIPGDTTTYYYWVAAANVSGTSAPSAAASAQVSSRTPVLSQPVTPGPVTGTSVSLTASATGTGGAITYIWTVASEPNGASVQLSDGQVTSGDGLLATPSSTIAVTFAQAGSYVFAVTASDSNGLSATMDVTVTVGQTLTSISVQSDAPTILNGGTDALSAAGADQFGNVMPLSSSINWSVSGVGGAVVPTTTNAAQANYTAPNSGVGVATVAVTSSGLSASALVEVDNSSIPQGPTGLIVVQAIEGEIDLAWNASSDPMVTYNVYVDSNPAFTPNPADEIASGIATNGYSDEFTSAPNVTWYYKVVSVAGSGSVSAPSIAVSAVMPSSTPDDYDEPGVDGTAQSVGSKSTFASQLSLSSQSSQGPEQDLVAFYGLNFPHGDAQNNPNFGNEFMQEIVDSGPFGIGGAGVADSFNLVGGRIYQDFQLHQAFEDVISLLDPNSTKVISSTQISAHEFYFLGYSWGAITAAELTTLFAKSNANLDGSRLPGPGRTGWHIVGGWRLDASVPIQVLETIDPVTSAFLISGLIRVTQPIQNNVKTFNNYYQRSGAVSTVGTEDNLGDPTGQAFSVPQGTAIDTLINGNLLPVMSGVSQYQTRVDVTLAIFDDCAPTDFTVTNFYDLFGSQVNHDTMPIYCYELVFYDFGLSLPGTFPS